MAQRNQIDHLIVKKAVAGLKPIDFDIFYYEDFPNFLPESKKLQVSTALKAIKVDISNVIEEKIQGIIQYDSLVEPYFKSKEILVELIVDDEVKNADYKRKTQRESGEKAIKGWTETGLGDFTSCFFDDYKVLFRFDKCVIHEALKDFNDLIMHILLLVIEVMFKVVILVNSG